MKVPFKDFNDKPRNGVAHFNLTETQVFKLFAEFKTILDWRESIAGPEREIDPLEVQVFYNALEEVLLSAWGVPSEDGLHFRKGGRYDFEESALFNACMVEFLSNPQEANKFLEGIMPKDMEDMIRKADVNMAQAMKESTDEDLKSQVALLRAQLEEKKAEAGSSA